MSLFFALISVSRLFLLPAALFKSNSFNRKNEVAKELGTLLTRIKKLSDKRVGQVGDGEGQGGGFGEALK